MTTPLISHRVSMHLIDRKYICQFVYVNKLIFAQDICSIIPKITFIFIYFVVIVERKMVSGKALATA